MKKKVNFTIEEPLKVEYDRALFSKDLRDRLIQYLIKYGTKKQSSGEIDGSSGLINYISAILHYALDAKFSAKELQQIKSMHSRFSFLQYHQTTSDNMIHDVSYALVALCNKDTKAVQDIVALWPIMDSKGSLLGSAKDLNREYLKALCLDVANLTKKCIEEFLKELQSTGKIMTSKELAEHKRELALSETDEENDYSNDKFEDESDNDIKLSSSDNGSQDVNQRSLSFQELKEENHKSKSASNNEEANITNNNSFHNLVLKKILSWINDLPEWLQKQILNSSVVRAVIESIEQNTKIYDKKVDLDIYQQDKFSSEADSFSYIDHEIDQKVSVSEALSSELVDTNMILDGTYVSGLILSTSGEQVINFNGLNFDNLAVFR